MLPPHSAPERQPPLFVGQPLILRRHHSIQDLHEWDLLIVQLSSTVTVPTSKPARINISSLDVQVFPQTIISICTTSLYRDSSSYQHMQAWDVSIAAWNTVLAGRQGRLLCRCAYLYKNYKILFGSQGSSRVKTADQVFIHFPPQFQALVLHCALTGWSKHIAGVTSRAFPPGIFSP